MNPSKSLVAEVDFKLIHLFRVTWGLFFTLQVDSGSTAPEANSKRGLSKA